jgi:hypothetical protein
MTDWKVGDYAVCVRRGEVRCPHDIRWLGRANPTTDAPLKVTSLRDATTTRGRRCGCLSLMLADGSKGLALRFRRVVPDARKAGNECRQLIDMLKSKERHDA